MTDNTGRECQRDGMGARSHSNSIESRPKLSVSSGLIIGVDLGGHGAIALVDRAGRLIAVADMPVADDGPKARPSVQPALLANLLREWQPAGAFVEFVSARPTDGPVGAFAFGKARGHVEAVLASLGIGMQMITPPTWKRAVGIGAGRNQKSTARAEAIRRWPNHAASFARISDDGRAEAALIAVAGLLRQAGTQSSSIPL